MLQQTRARTNHQNDCRYPVSTPLLQLQGIRKTYPGVVACDDVDLKVEAGSLHVLMGENGAGKSTLINIASGVVHPDQGVITLDGREMTFRSPVEARQAGIVAVHQEAELFPTLSVAENMALGVGYPVRRLGMIDWKQVADAADQAVRSTGECILSSANASTLSVAQRHMIQVAAAVRQQAKIVILDEPTSALSARECEWLFDQIARLKSRGAGIVYITHRQEEVERLADRVTVLRDGRRVWSGRRTEATSEELIRHMVGRSTNAEGERESHRTTRLDDTTAAASRPGTESDRVAAQPALFELRDLGDARGRVRRVSLRVGRGEVVGWYGLIGAGRTETAQTVFGLRKRSAGEVLLNGDPLEIRNAADAIQNGIAYLPEDRLREGVCRGQSVRSNAVLSVLKSLAWGPWCLRSRESVATQGLVESLDIRLNSIEQPIGGLSGGNQQKVVLGRCLLTEPDVLLLDEPTRGIDVNAKSQIHRQLRAVAESGCAVVLISSELPEVMAHCDRVIVFRDGEVAGEVDPEVGTSHEIARLALPADDVRSAIESAPDQPTSGESGDGSQRGLSAPAPTQRTSQAAENRPHEQRERLREEQQRSTQQQRGTVGWWKSAETGLVLILAALWAALNIGGDLDSVASGFLNLLTWVPMWALLGVAAACVIMAGGIDISIGSIVALSAVCAGLVFRLQLPESVAIPLALVVAIAVGTMAGMLNAGISLVGRVHPIVVTLGTMSIYRGLVTLILGGQSMTGVPPLLSRLAIDPDTGFRGIAVVAVFVLLAVAVWLARWPSGRHVYAMGASESAAALAGISRTRTWLTAFGVGGGLAGLTGVLALALNPETQAQLGAGWELRAIAVAVIGGVAITGGRGSVFGVVLGAVLLRLVDSALVRWEAGERSELVYGALLLTAVSIDLIWRRKSR